MLNFSALDRLIPENAKRRAEFLQVAIAMKCTPLMLRRMLRYMRASGITTACAVEMFRHLLPKKAA